jgi:predicted TIM-barrel fold metal-dependent hydrolase
MTQPDPPLDRSRRGLLQAGALALGAASLGAFDAAAADAPAEGAIDAHSHIWTPDVKRYPLAAGFQVADMQPASFTPEQLLAEAQPCGVARVVLIQMSYYRFDNSYMLAAMREHPGVFGGVAVIDEHASGLGETMRDLKRQGVRGFRIHPATQAVDRWLSSEGMAAMWRLGADERLAMCALVNPDALVPLEAMCRKFPETPLVIDHFARIGVDGTIHAADLDNLCRLARYAHVNVKISAFYALGKKQAPYTDLGPMIRRLRDAFGAERLMWATDCPYQVQMGHAYCDSIELVRSRLDFLTPADRRAMLMTTAERVFFS